MQVAIDPSHPIMAGMPEMGGDFRGRQSRLRDAGGFSGRVLARYAETGSPLLSGYLIGENICRAKQRRSMFRSSRPLVLLGFRPEWRGHRSGRSAFCSMPC